MYIEIIQVGKSKEEWVRLGEAEFLKRLRAFARVEIVVIPETGKGDRKKILVEDGKKILAKLADDTFVCLLSVRGKQLTSREFSRKLEEWQTRRGGRVTFVLGGSWGVSQDVAERAGMTLSLSKMTFLHEMARIFLLEQIYRGFMILRGSEYHKGVE